MNFKSHCTFRQKNWGQKNIRLIFLSSIFLSSIAGVQKPAASPRLVLDKDTGISLREDFDAELLFTVPESQGSWIAMAFDPKGRLSEQYMASSVTLKDVGALSGGLIFRNDKELAVASNPFDLNQLTKAPADKVESVEFSQVSIMPPGTISGMNRDELMDLMAYLLSGGDARHKAFKKE